MPPDLDAATLAQHAAAFRGFAAHRAGPYAPFTGALADTIADQPALLGIAATARAGQSRVDLLLAALHLLVLDLPDPGSSHLVAGHPVAAAYRAASVGPPALSVVEEVIAFAHDHRAALAEIVATRTVQTNEIGRNAFLLPALVAAGAHARGRRLALVEVGASAGLNLVPDRYRFVYRPGEGQPEHPGELIRLEPVDFGVPAPTLDCELRGTERPPLAPAPDIGERVGLDLQPLDPADPADRRWLRALVWPEHTERRRRLDQALALALAADAPPPPVHQGDAAEVAGFVEAVPRDQHPVITHCAVTAHMTPAARAAFAAAVAHASRGRALSWLQAEPRDDGDPRRLRLLHVVDGEVVDERALASYHPHGAVLTWSRDLQPSPRAQYRPQL